MDTPRNSSGTHVLPWLVACVIPVLAIGAILLPTARLQAAPDLALVKRVDNPTPMPNEPVEFLIEVYNGDTALADIHVMEMLPAEVVIPPGMAAFASTGAYDRDTGDWSVGDLGVNERATLSVPAIILGNSPPDCIVNMAVAIHPDDWNRDKNSASVALRQPGVERCVDLSIDFGIAHYSEMGRGLFYWRCDSEERYAGRVTLGNRGPDIARNVVVTIEQNPVLGQNLRFDDPACGSPSGPSCWIQELGVGGQRVLKVTSDLYRLYESAYQTISVGVTTSDTDYVLSDNYLSKSGMAVSFSDCDPREIDFGLKNLGEPGCFIATAAYGSDLDPHVDALRRFRDRHLVTTAWGRRFVRLYYRHSTPIAAYVAPRPWARGGIRALLAPLVTAVEYPLTALAIAVLLLAGVATASVGRDSRRRRISARHRCGLGASHFTATKEVANESPVA